MNGPGSTREALIAEAIGDLARLLDRAEALQPALAQACDAFTAAHHQFASQFAAFEVQMGGLTERAKVQAAKHILARSEEAARRSIDLQSRAMADAARVAFGMELGATLQRLQSTLQPLLTRSTRRWERWLTHAAAATAASALTWALAAYAYTR